MKEQKKINHDERPPCHFITYGKYAVTYGKYAVYFEFLKCFIDIPLVKTV